MSIDSKITEADETPMGKIERQIHENNIKYWQNRFLFGPEFIEFMMNFTNGYSSDLSKENFLVRNDDYHITKALKHDQHY